jgi:RNA polymerase sigma-70 factor (ECF subfamily)
MPDFPQPIALQGLSLTRQREAAACEDRFAALVSRQSRFVFRVAYSVLRNIQDSEDVVQETFLRLYRSRAWESMDDEKAFIARVAWRIAIDRTRKASSPASGRDIPSGAETPEQEVIAADWKAAFHRLIDALPEELRQPLALSTVEELNSQQIGDVMGIPEGTVRSRLTRARQVLRQKAAAFMGRSM